MSGRSQYDAAWGTALRLLGYRPRTEREVRDRLARRFSEDVVADVVEALTEQGLLDDARFSSQWTESRSARNPRSARMIARELQVKGVDASLAEQAVRDVDDEESAYQACRKYARTGGRPDDAAFQRRLLGYLRRRGFSQSVSRRAMRRMIDGLGAGDEEQSDGGE